LDIAACYLLEFEISGDIGRDEDVCKPAVCHEKLWDKIDVPVIDTSILLPWLGALLVVAVLLEELRPISIAEAEMVGQLLRSQY